jgi:hypothetical protein
MDKSEALKRISQMPHSMRLELVALSDSCGPCGSAGATGFFPEPEHPNSTLQEINIIPQRMMSLLRVLIRNLPPPKIYKFYHDKITINIKGSTFFPQKPGWLGATPTSRLREWACPSTIKAH